MTVVPPAVFSLLDRARDNIHVDQIGRWVMQDPGTGAYVQAFEDVLRRGMPAVEPSFDLTENLGPGVNWTHATDDAFRWFRILTSLLGLAVRDEWPAALPIHQILVALLVDGLALDPPGRAHGGANVGLRGDLEQLCRQFPPMLEDPREAGFFILGELMLLDPPQSDPQRAAVEARCAALLKIARDCEEYYRPGTDWQVNPWFVSAPELVWGWVDDHELHPVWVHLVDRYFPTEPSAARSLRQRLLRDGAPWAHGRRRLS